MASTVTELLRRRFGGKKGAVVEYIENPSTAYIDTGIGMPNVAKLIITFSNHTSGFITGYNTSNGTAAFFIYNNVIQYQYRPSGYSAINNGAKHQMELSSGTLILDGATFTFGAGTSTYAGNTMVCKASNDNRRSACRIYAFDLLDANSDYLFKGRPAYEGGRYGLKDAVSGNFFGSASDVEFIGG